MIQGQNIRLIAMNILQLYDDALKIGLIQHPHEINALWAFVSALRPKCLMEIGSFAGGVFDGFCKVSDPNGICISLDISDSDWKNPQNKNSVRLVCDSHSMETKQKVINVLNGQLLDFLFIDGDHSYEGVKMDYQMYSGLVRKGGWIAFHDINETEFHNANNCHVDKLWKELTGTKIEINAYNFSGGIGIIQSS